MAVHKALVLLSCTFLGLVCGTLYLFSSYSPQLASRLGYSATDSSTMALCGTVGVAVAGPVVGALVDRRGYSLAVVLGAALIVCSYAVLHRQYVRGEPAASVPLSAGAMFLVGCGSTFINSATIKCAAVCFPAIRGIATALPLALYGLSAMVFSTMASVVCPGDTERFLVMLMVSVVVLVALCTPSLVVVDRGDLGTVPPAPVLAPTNEKPAPAATKAYAELASDTSLWASPQFWLYFAILGLGAALGQMYIYSVGYMVKALSVGASADAVAAAQRAQVSLLSAANCAGRVLAGAAGDWVVAKKMSRTGLVVVPVLGLCAGQVLGGYVGQASQLWVTSVAHGVSYGFLFCMMPLLVGDTFGLAQFSYNWGIVNLAPIVPSYVLTSWFGRVYDSSSEEVPHTEMVDGAPVTVTSLQCVRGVACYARVFSVTTVVAVVAVAVAMVAVTKRTARRAA
ncbi:hypothetical protein DICA0_F07492 [Diutina catenulata]